ncbi:hypothetical protein EB118_01970 [bacterium]|nr:hypothetical protein [bacterium]NDC94184.1 hypothetical protein [bacterium]NDD83016.1 hypothetical protein [bacterium]NDG28854.1 hypothetical protein [bacterium]
MWGSLFIFTGMLILAVGSFFDGQKQGLIESNVNSDVEKTQGELLFTFGAVFILIGVIINITSKYDTIFLSSGIVLLTLGTYFVGKMEALKKNNKSFEVEKVRGYVLTGFGIFFVIAAYFIKFTGKGAPSLPKPPQQITTGESTGESTNAAA